MIKIDLEDEMEVLIYRVGGLKAMRRRYWPEQEKMFRVITHPQSTPVVALQLRLPLHFPKSWIWSPLIPGGPLGLTITR